VLFVCAVFAVDLGPELGKKAVQRLGRSDRSLQAAPVPESNYVSQGILEANTVRGAVRAQQLHAGGCEIGFEAGNINLFPGS